MSFWKKNNRNRTLHISDASHPRFRKLNCESLEARNLLSCSSLGSVEPFCGPLLPPPEILHGYVSFLEVRSETITIPELIEVPETPPVMGPMPVSFPTPISFYSSSLVEEGLVQASFQESSDESDGVLVIDRTEWESVIPASCVDESSQCSSSNVSEQDGSGIRRVVFSNSASVENQTSGDAVVIPFESDGSSDDDLPRRSGGGDPEVWNLSLTVDSSHTNSGLSTTNRPNALVERRDVSGGASNPQSDADYLTFTAPALPAGYVAKITFSGSATPGTDYHVYDSSFNIVGLANDGTYSYSGGPVVFNIAPVNDSVVESSEGVTASLGNPTPIDESGGPGVDSVTFTYGTRTVSATIIDDDHWKINIAATDSVASERLPGVEPDYGMYTFTRVYSDESIPTLHTGDLSYGINVNFVVYEKPSSKYYSAKPVEDYALSDASLGSNDVGVYLSDYNSGGATCNGDASSETLEIFHHCSGTIPAETESVKLRLAPTFDWKDEGDRYDPSDANVANPGVQTGEKVKITLKSAAWNDKGDWEAVGDSSVAEVEIKDGAILEEYLDYDGDGNLDVDKSIANEYGSIKLYETDADLRYAKLYAWVGKLEGEDDSRYRFDVYQNFPTGTRTSLRLWNDDHRGTLYQATVQNPARRLIGSLEQDGDSVFSDFWLERIEYDKNTLSADADCFLGDENDVFIDVPTYDASDSVAIYDPLYVADIDADSDNNGYINQELAPSEWEDSIEGRVGKRITYFPSTTGVPKDYIYTEIKLKNTSSDSTGLKWSVHYTGNLEVYKKLRGSQQYVKIISNDKQDFIDSNNEQNSHKFEDYDYFVKAVGASSNTGFESGLDKVHFVLWKKDDPLSSLPLVEVARDTVCFSVQDGSLINGWIAPNGWAIDSAGNLTTPTPHKDAVGPKIEGSGVVSNKGDAYLDLHDEFLGSGFELDFIYEFTKNGNEGYLQPDTNGNEVAGDESDEDHEGDKKKISFVGNSGVRFGENKSSTEKAVEIAILDTKAMAERCGGLIKMDPSSITETTVMTVVMHEVDTDEYIPRVQPPDNFNQNSDQPRFVAEELSRLLNGVRYLHNNYPSMYDYNKACLEHPNASEVEQYYYTLVENYNNCQTSNHMKIVWVPTSVAGSVWTGTIRVYLNDMQRLYYEESGVEFRPSENSYRIYLQSHWGSGVRFSSFDVRQTAVQG